MSYEQQFKKNIEEALNDAGNPWTTKDNDISNLPPAERKKYLGANAPDDHRTNAAYPSNPGTTILPQNYDLRNVNGENFITPPKNQSSCGSCVAFGVIGAIEGTLKKQLGNPSLTVDISEAHLFFCNGGKCENGWWPDPALNVFKNSGIAEEACYPYNKGLQTKDCSGLQLDPNRNKYKLTSSSRLSNSTNIKEWLINYGPAIACFDVYRDFYSYGSGVYKHLSGNLEGGHCVIIVGFDDNDQGGCWICKNSWDVSWGDKGYFRIGYGECRIDTWGNYGAKGIQVSKIGVTADNMEVLSH